MPPHPRVRAHGTLEVAFRAFRQTAEVGAAQGFGGDADFEALGVEQFGHGEAGAVDADGVAEVGVVEDGGAVGDCQGGAVAAGGAGVEGGEGCDCAEGFDQAGEHGGWVGGGWEGVGDGRGGACRR